MKLLTSPTGITLLLALTTLVPHIHAHTGNIVIESIENIVGNVSSVVEAVVDAIARDDPSAQAFVPTNAKPLEARSGSKSWTGGDFTSSWMTSWKVTKDSYGAANRALTVDPTGAATGKVLQITYPAGTRNPANGNVGGTGFYASPLSMTKTVTAELTYQVFFPKGFNFVLGGKLPGLYGGHSGCTGGNSALDCFSTRFMFRTKGLGEIYMYVDRSLQNNAFCLVKPVTLCNPTYGASMGRGSYTFKTGAWTTVSQTITMNTFTSKGKPNQDGRVQVYANGKKVIDFAQLVLAGSSDIPFVGIDFETFFGGNDDTWCTPTTQQTYFKGFSLTIV
ncbi:hypothetical protein HKX48_007199 [Thoreauomyces humboldtii]|nr:hypothetical protein HKX48_007199 [Thoreauomyces humboldtii]